MLPAWRPLARAFLSVVNAGLTILCAILYNTSSIFSRFGFTGELPGPALRLQVAALIATANITMQFGAKPLFENVSAKLVTAIAMA